MNRTEENPLLPIFNKQRIAFYNSSPPTLRQRIDLLNRLHHFLITNQKPITNSGGWTFAAPGARSKLIVNQFIMPLAANDKIRLMFTSSAPSMGLMTVPATEIYPASPGVAFTILKLG